MLFKKSCKKMINTEKNTKKYVLRMKTMLCISGNSDQCFGHGVGCLTYSSRLLNNQQWFSGNQASFPPLVDRYSS